VKLTPDEIFFQEQLFVSKKSVFDGKKAIRGGIPFVFPIFGASNVLPQHGFARISR
jgi:glucose-6-phosphate 1-epimerase